MNRIAWTPEDQLIVVRAVERGVGSTLVSMMAADRDDAIYMREHEFGKYVDEMYEHYLEQQIQEWWQNELVLDELEANADYCDDGYTF